MLNNGLIVLPDGTLTISSLVKDMDHYFFSNHPEITSVTVSTDNQRFFTSNGVLYSKEDGVLRLLWCPKEIGPSFIVPANVKTIGYAAFERCRFLKTIFFPESVSEIPDDVCEGCDSLEEISVDPKNQYYSSNDGILYSLVEWDGDCEGVYCSEYKRVLLVPQKKAGIITIDKDTQSARGFGKCDLITKIILPSGIESVGDLPSSPVFRSIENSGEYGIHGFPYFTKDDVLYYVELYANPPCPDPFERIILDCVPSGKEGSLTLHDDTNIIGFHAFNKSHLTDVVLPKCLTQIAGQAFVECHMIKSLTLPESIREVGPSAFINCFFDLHFLAPRSKVELDKEAFKGFHGNVFWDNE